MHAATATGRPQSGNRWFFLMNHVLRSIGQMAVGVYGVKRLKANTLQQLPEDSKQENEALWSGECFCGIPWVHLSLWKGQVINRKL